MADETTEEPNFDDVANYPLACREAFLEQTVALRTASAGRRLHFILPRVGEILDDYLLWLTAFGD